VAEQVAVIGAAGYGGAVAAAILHRHPSLELTAVTARADAGRRHDALYPRYRVPLVLREWELEGPAAAFELDADLLFELAADRVATYSDVTSFPAVLQDIAVIVPEDVPAARLAEVVRAGAGELLASMRVFDLYHGEQVGEGSKSLALRLEFRALDRTLTDDEVAERRTAIERALEPIGARLRA